VESTLNKQRLAEFYRQMLLIRRFEEACGRLYMQGKIRGFLHLYIGEEAIAVGAISALRPDDYVIGHYRDHGHAIAKGMDPKIAMAELCGKATGSSGGKGGSMHLFDVERHFMGGHAIVGGQMPIAAGLALSSKYKKEDLVTLCFFGDGAVNQGEFHETLNLASVWKLPILFLLENNLYGMGTHVDRTHAGGRHIYEVASAYDIPGVQIDGMDVLGVNECVSEAVKSIRKGEGPRFIEAMCYRYRGHSMADPTMYRERDEAQELGIKDPIDSLKNFMIQFDVVGEEELAKIAAKVDEQVNEAVQFAEDSPAPEMDAMYTNVYA
jgi:pyruvate dehydrogenase E1 component alpha subunit